MNIETYKEDGYYIKDLAESLGVSTQEAVYLMVKFYQLKESTDIQAIKWKLIKKLEAGNMNWHYLLSLRFLYITLGEILTQTHFHVNT